MSLSLFKEKMQG